ncbi:MAG: hypothetical protein EOO17_06165, partial [Chloroflexi bacterium]
MSTATLVASTPLNVRVVIGRGISRGDFIFHTNRSISEAASHHSTIRPDNLEQRLPRFSEGVQRFVEELLGLDHVTGVDIGAQSFKLYCASETTLDDVYDNVEGQLRKFLNWDGDVHKRVT